jgi:hypothetical protein
VGGIMNDLPILKVELKLMFGLAETSFATFLSFFVFGLDLACEGFLLEVLLIEVLGIDALMVETLPKELTRLVTPHLFPFTLALLPLFQLLLKPVEDDGKDGTGSFKHRLPHFGSPIAIIQLHNDALWYGFTLATQSSRQHESGALSIIHQANLLAYRFHQLNGPVTGFNVKVVVMPFFF